jgi:hypothetical protein
MKHVINLDLELKIAQLDVGFGHNEEVIAQPSFGVFHRDSPMRSPKAPRLALSIVREMTPFINPLAALLVCNTAEK